MSGIVLYMSKHGSTRQYAEWIGERTGFQVVDLKKEKAPNLADVDIVVIGSWIFTSKMVAHGWIKKNWKGMREKKMVVFSTSGADPDQELKKKFMESRLPREISSNVAYFPLQGRFRKEDQSLIMRGMLNIAAKMDKESDLAQDLVHGVDGVKKENLEEMLEYISTLSE